MSRFSSIEQLSATCNDLPERDEQAAMAASARQDTLTKPQGSLGRLEELAIFLAGWQGRAVPKLDQVAVIVFAGSHGVTARGVSAFPAEVTAQMVANFAAGGAAINQLAHAAGAGLAVVPLEIERPTADFTTAPAMTEDEFLAAVSTGYDAVSPTTDLLCLGEMGIGNTTAAAALAAALFGGKGADWVGRGTGVDDAGLSRKAAAVDAAIAFHGSALFDPLAALARVGGRELAAIFGAVLAARRYRIPVLLDGFVCTAAAAPLARLRPTGLAHALAAHMSAEAGHRDLLGRLGLKPLLDFNMRLGEASGACLAVNLMRSALACHAGMASFAEAGVSEK
ncbi:nicotinate-nucleotide--dimethylbenzimidazole phosphoribosyltransferase [Mesorhizobium sp. L-8-10]|uniref:nicotinate-nucleotide--dimethylbenzimidazole phosphoribosyltransferase n=1 Tax=Mesorhizobium sp. L-8-10 TaxID=2744523 RepID=UPI001927F889|nr:nicotinate-nucleotide--dimethylbenzimidazole phosphoribosyltransferase [Mesorhizobium sp. L-8-10]BCH35449.1 nicotinate-nucleotide--dimethylbenzimidazole phosphoribosyltransferase [Mesorhizobium sp. L-8-10]